MDWIGDAFEASTVVDHANANSAASANAAKPRCRHNSTAANDAAAAGSGDDAVDGRLEGSGVGRSEIQLALRRRRRRNHFAITRSVYSKQENEIENR